MTTSDDEEEIRQILKAIEDRCRSDDKFKADIKIAVNQRSDNFFMRLLEDILGFLKDAIPAFIMSGLKGLFPA